MKESIAFEDLSREFHTRENCHILELSNTPDDPDVSIARARVAPGETTRWHRLADVTERYYIVSGNGLMELGDLPPQEVGPGDVVLIPPMTRQRITNTAQVDLIFLAICSPRFTIDAYQDLEPGVASE